MNGALPAVGISAQDRLIIYLSVLIALFLAALDQTIVSTALPMMVQDLQGIDRYAWVATAYLLASTALALVYGKLADTYSRKYVTLGAIGLFLTGSVLCGMSGQLGNLPLLGDGMTQLIVFRGIQGAGGGGLFAMTFIVIADLYTPAERGKYQGWVGAVFGIASILGPLVGGLLTDHAGGWIPGIAGWRWVFYVNVPIGGIALWFIVRRMPRLDPPAGGVRPDFFGGVLLLAGLIPAILALQLDKRRYPWLPSMATDGATTWEAWATVVTFGTGVALLGAFVARSRRAASPILDLSLFENRVFATANQATFFIGASFMAITIFLPLFLVNVLGVSATRAGAALIPFSMGVVFSATMAGQMVNRTGYRWPIFGGALLYLLTVILLATMGSDVPYWRITVYMVLAGLGVGPGMPLFTLAIQNAVDVRFVGQATSASQFFRQTGATVGAALMGTVLGTSLGIAFATLNLPEEVTAAPDVSIEQLVSTGGTELPELVRDAYESRAVLAPTPEAADAVRREGEAEAQRIARGVREAFTTASSRIYWLTAVILALAALMCLRIPELPLRTTHDRAEVRQEGGGEG